VHRLKQGDLKALEELVLHYQEQVYRLAYGLLQDPEESQDVTQEAFLRVYQSIHRFAEKSAFFTWLYRIVVNLCHDSRRRKAKRKNEVSLDQLQEERDLLGEPPLELPDLQGIPADQYSADRELERKVKSAMDSLPEKHRITLLLREVEGLSYEEIAQATEVNIGTVMSRLHYARKRMQELLKPYLEDTQP
jgi:RNA polymerase sigma-70 factor (ECF subfamily)